MKTTLRQRLLFFFWVWAVGSKAQGNEGVDFRFGFMEHYDAGQNSMVVMITSKYNATGQVSIPLQGWSKDFSVSANGIMTVQLPSSAENTSSEVTEGNGVRVISDVPVSVYIHQYHSMRSEATVVLPVQALGRAYYAMSYTGYADTEVYPSEMLLVGVEDDTEITVVMADESESGLEPGEMLTVELDAGETYQIQAAQSSGDLTGTYAKGNKKFSVLAGCRWTQLPQGCNFRDNLLEQMYPVSSWGRQFVSAPFSKMPYDVFRVMASENNTRVTVKGSTIREYTLNAGEFAEYISSVAAYVSATHPVAVAQYLIGSTCSGYRLGDPSMLILNSVDQMRDTVTLFSSPFEAIEENHINLICRTVDLPDVRFDGRPLSELNADMNEVAANGEYSYARLRVNAGAHTITTSGCGVIATAYGYGNIESYAYGGGAGVRPRDADNLIPEGGCVQEALRFDTGLKAPRFSFDWDLGDGGRAKEATFTHAYPSAGDYKVTLYLTDNCLDLHDTLSRTIHITQRQLAEVPGDVAVCARESIQLSAGDLPGAVFEWTGPNGFRSDRQSFELPDAQPAQSGVYTVRGIITGCASYPATAKVDIFPLPQPELGADAIICPKGENVSVTLHPGNFTRYEWQNRTTQPSLEAKTAGLYWVNIQDINSCTGADSLTVREICPTRYYIPNAFSPNDDGENDYFAVFGADIIAQKLRVFDRWGNLLFESDKTGARWDGYYRGQVVEPGVYAWMAHIEGYKKDGGTYAVVESGSLTLIR